MLFGLIRFAPLLLDIFSVKDVLGDEAWAYVLVWGPSEEDSEARIQEQVDFLEDDLRKHH